jgi:site-specific DNA recombinase
MHAAIYARKSSEQTGVADDQKSVARQVEHAKSFAAGKGWEVREDLVFVDDGISGAEFAGRPGFVRLMNALKPRPTFQVLVMSEESRLGREQIEVSYALKQLVTAGVRVFSYLTDTERTLNSPIEKAMLALQTMADEMEREKARQRTGDAMVRKARAGHVTGGCCFGYRNVEVVGADGRRSHVERTVDAQQAAVISRIFRLCADGYGMKAIAKILNDDGALSPRAQRGRSHTWAPASVREVLFRPSYRGEIVWNATKKRDRWGQQHQTARPESEWIRVDAPHLRIVEEGLWTAAHARLATARAIYLNGTGGRPFGRPAMGNPSPYLLTNLAACDVCGSGFRVRTRDHGATRAKFYGCSGYHERGRAVCTMRHELPMSEGDAIVLEALLDDVLDPSIVDDAIEVAVSTVEGVDVGVGERLARLDRDLRQVDDERDRLVAAIAAGGTLSGLVGALREREERRAALASQRAALVSQRRGQAADGARLRAGLRGLAEEWRQVLAGDPECARPVVSQLLDGRVVFARLDDGRWRMTGKGTLAGLFTRETLPAGMASPARKTKVLHGLMARTA